MLLPAIKMVRDSAKTTKCMSNLRQFQAANISYSGENEGYFVPAYFLDMAGARRDGWMDNDDWVYAVIDSKTTSGGMATQASSLLKAQLCPLSKPNFITSAVATSYGYNYPSNVAVALGEMARPHSAWPGIGNKVAFADALDPDIKYAKADPRFWWAPQWPTFGQTVNEGQWNTKAVAYRHFQRAVIACFDGHVESQPWNTLFVTTLWY